MHGGSPAKLSASVFVALLQFAAALSAETPPLAMLSASDRAPRLRRQLTSTSAVPVLSATALVTRKSGSCHVGDAVFAYYEGDGQYYGAIVENVQSRGWITLKWYNSDPNHRTVEAGKVLKGGTSCAVDASETLARQAPPRAPHVGLDPPEPRPSAQNSTQDPVPGVVTFLFLLTDELEHMDIWASFFASAPAGSWQAFAHCKDPEACHASGLLNIPGMRMVQTTPTWYCHDLVTAMAHLLQSGLSLPHGGGNEKFVFVSDSTLPAKPFAEIHTQLMADWNSDMCLFPKEQWASANIDGHSVLMPKHHQWVVLNRFHAELFVREWVPVSQEGVWRVWLRGGSWTGKERFVSPQHFYHPPQTNWCTDEWAFAATIFGVIEVQSVTSTLPAFGGGPVSLWGPPSEKTQGKCRTFTFWDASDGDSMALLAKQINQDWGSRLSCYPKCHQRPATIEELSMHSLQAIRHSEFLFVRKFSPYIHLADYPTVVLQ